MSVNSKFDKILEKLDRSNQKVKEVLECELEAARGQGEAARKSAEEAQEQISHLTARRPELAANVFAGDAEYSTLDELDSEIARVGRHLEVAEIAEGEASKRALEIEERLKEAERQETEGRYDLYARERRTRSEELEATLSALVGQLDGLLDLDQQHRQVAGKLGMRIGVAYREALDNRLRCKLFGYIKDVGPFVTRLPAKNVAATLPESDPLATTLKDAREANAALLEQYEQQDAEREAARQAKARRERYNYRKTELYAKYGACLPGAEIPGGPGRRGKVDVIVAGALSREFPDLFQAEQEQQREAKRAQLRQTLAPDEPVEGMSEERREEVEAAVDSWLESETPSVPAVN